MSAPSAYPESLESLDHINLIRKMKCRVPGCRKIKPVAFCATNYHVMCANHYVPGCNQVCPTCAEPLDPISSTDLQFIARYVEYLQSVCLLDMYCNMIDLSMQCDHLGCSSKQSSYED
ncbi:hypothetical protein M8J76_000164 [Diaphorina citri]|nr:hypothetical protein M8J75_000840 [Diaphorina citri]KAI5736114.1 hypothetical protein M8J76_000164 [Diaphorina citri]KAI5743274.1 hypothetical protein M8J77_016314 [Diaphorina citri]